MILKMLKLYDQLMCDDSKPSKILNMNIKGKDIII
jgi:hypothetical protein